MGLSRRTFLIGGATAAALAACGDDGGSEGSADDTVSTTTAAGGLAIARVFAPTQPQGITLRLPIALTDSQGALLDEVPTRIRVQWGEEGSTELGPLVDVRRHAQGIPTPYFPVVATFPTLGRWRIRILADGDEAETSVEVVPVEEVPAVPGAGEALIPLQTPTVDDGRGVDPVCTREPPCPFHDVALDEALESGKAVAFLISTPAFCQTAICGPVLDLLVERKEQLDAAVAFVHAEVYTDRTARTTTEAVQAYGLTYEPALFLAAPDGTVASRLDYTFDATELDEALSFVVQ